MACATSKLVAGGTWEAERRREAMRLLLTATILLLSSSWTLGQSGAPTTPSDNSQNTGSSAPSMQQPDNSQQPKDPGRGKETVEGCLSGAANTFVLTDASGITYELTGATHELDANIGHKVRLTGTRGSTGGGGRISASGNQRTFGVKKVESLSDTCK
jgi:Protein of unknown function (DUF5818)